MEHAAADELVARLLAKGLFVRTRLDENGRVVYDHCKQRMNGTLQKVGTLTDEQIRLLESENRLHKVRFEEHGLIQRASVRIILTI